MILTECKTKEFKKCETKRIFSLRERIRKWKKRERKKERVYC